MTTESPRKVGDTLQFDNVVTTQGGPAPDEPAVTCAHCQQTLTTEYYSVNSMPVCARCKDAAESAITAGLAKRRFPKALGFGLLGAVGGAIVYYGVIALTDFEIGIIAILCGFMVGWAVRYGAGGLGGRRYQILAAALTYFSVGLAYTPLAFKAAKEGALASADSAAVDSTRANNPDAIADSLRALAIADSMLTDSLIAAENGDSTVVATLASTAKPPTAAPDPAKLSPAAAIGIGLAALLVFVWALPVFAVFGSMPGGLISALIIGIGMRQAWQMTAAAPLDVSGPFKVGGLPAAAPAPAPASA